MDENKPIDPIGPSCRYWPEFLVVVVVMFVSCLYAIAGCVNRSTTTKPVYHIYHYVDGKVNAEWDEATSIHSTGGGIQFRDLSGHWTWIGGDYLVEHKRGDDR